MSKTVVDSGNQSSFFQNMSAANERVLLLDYDGTIAPFHPDRHRAYPYPKVPELLRRIMTGCRTRLIMISGRAAHEVAPLLGINPRPETWGSHGLERLHPDGRYEEVDVDEEALQVLAQAESLLEREGLGSRIEIKLAAVAVHWRGLPPSEVLTVRTKAYTILERLSTQPGLVLAEFDEGAEIRLQGANKGNALKKLLSEVRSDIPVAYLGDDITDEDAFRVLNGRGLTVLVRPKHRFTAAQVWLKPPDELIQFLTQWIRVSGGDA